MYTIGKLAKAFGLSRSTLLYYDSIGLLNMRKSIVKRHTEYEEFIEQMKEGMKIIQSVLFGFH